MANKSAKTDEKALVPATGGGEVAIPADVLGDVLQDAGLGSEQATSEDIALPFIKCAQMLSDEMKESKPDAYIPDLREGDFFNSITKRIFPRANGVYFVPVYYVRKYLEWGPKRGDGFKGEHGPDIMTQVKRDGVKNVLPNGNLIVPTATWFGFVVDRETGEVKGAVIALSSTQMKKSRQLMYKLKDVTVADGKGGRFTPPIFYNVVHITSVAEGNDQGDWMGWKFETAGNVFALPGGEGIYREARRLYELVKSGAVKTAAPDDDGSRDAGDDGEGGEAPF